MIYILLFLVSLVSPVHAVAADHFDLNFPNPVKVSELAKIVYGEILSENFILEPDLLKDDAVVSSNLRDMTKLTVGQAFASVLQLQGYQAEKINGVNFIRKRRDADNSQIFYYRPMYRKTDYLIGLSSALFKKGSFTSQRSVKSQPVPVIAPSGLSPSKPSVSDSGISATSVIDKDIDSLIFNGPQVEIDLLKKVLAQIDTPVQQVFVKGTVYEVTTTSKEGSAFGLAVSLLKGRFGISIGGTAAPIGDLITFKNASIDAVFSALNSDNHFKSVSNPSLRVQSGASARFSVGSDVPVLGAVQMDRNGNPVQSVEYKPSGVIFDLKPTIHQAGIDLVINQQLSSFIPTTSGVNGSPTLIKREISTTVGAIDNDVIVLGGLDEDKSSADSSGFSFLPAFLKSRGGEVDKTQILLVLQVQKI